MATKKKTEAVVEEKSLDVKEELKAPGMRSLPRPDEMTPVTREEYILFQIIEAFDGVVPNIEEGVTICTRKDELLAIIANKVFTLVSNL